MLSSVGHQSESRLDQELLCHDIEPRMMEDKSHRKLKWNFGGIYIQFLFLNLLFNF